MKKYLILVLSMMLLFITLVACDGDEAEAPVEAPPQEAADKGDPGEQLIPRECLESEAAFEECWNEGLIPEECLDEDGQVYEECLQPEAETSAQPSTSNESEGLIPQECLESEETFEQCWNEGLIPEDCLDADGYIVESCLGGGGTSDGGGGSAPPPDAGDPGSDAADSGFRPTVDGFSFENYGGEENIANLTPAEMERMFGDQVCANQSNGCTLTPPARQWMEQMNEGMSGGHCEGMAVLSSLMYFDKMEPQDFGGNITYDLSLIDNEPLQREIAYWWVTQATYPGGVNKINESPSTVVDALMESFNQGKDSSEWWALGLYKPDFSGGHAITPFAVEDKGGGIYHIYVYDNNYPGQTRVVEVNKDANTWAYEASVNPGVEADLYEGDASTQTLEIVAISPRLETQEAGFDEQAMLPDEKGFGLASPLLQGQDVVEIWLDGDADLLITTEDGKRIGWLEDGTFVNEIPNAKSTDLRFAGIEVWDINEEPVYLLPADSEFFTITVDGSRLKEASPAEVTMIGPGYDLVLEQLWLDPGEKDTIDVYTFGPDHYGLTYSTQYNDTPDILMGIATDEADYEFVTRGTDIESGGVVNVELDFSNGDFILNTTGNEEYGTYALLVLRIDDDGEYVFGHNDINLEPNDTMYLNFLEWEGEGSSTYLDFDYGSDGSIDETIELVDEEDFYEDFYQDWE